MVYFGYSSKQYCFGVLGFFLIFTRKQHCFTQNMLFYLFGIFMFKHRSLNFAMFFNLVLVVFFYQFQYFLQYSSWLHLKWSLNLSYFSKPILSLLFLIHPWFYLWLRFYNPFILLPFSGAILALLIFNCLANLTLLSFCFLKLVLIAFFFFF